MSTVNTGDCRYTRRVNPRPQRRLVVDDLRTFRFPAVYARTSTEAIPLLDQSWDSVWFDHDLGGDDTIGPVLDAIAEAAFHGNPYQFRTGIVHTSNPPGRDMIARTLRRWGYLVQVVDPTVFLQPG